MAQPPLSHITLQTNSPLPKNLLPAEIWLQILEDIDSRSLWQTLRPVCPLFKRISEKYHIGHFLPQVQFQLRIMVITSDPKNKNRAQWHGPYTTKPYSFKHCTAPEIAVFQPESLSLLPTEVIKNFRSWWPCVDRVTVKGEGCIRGEKWFPLVSLSLRDFNNF